MTDIDKIAAKRARAHTRYYRKNGVQVPGTTSVLGVLNKRALAPWANKLGLAGIDMATYVDTLAEVGHIAHDMILCHNKRIPWERNGSALDLVDRAENSYLSYLEWEKGHKVEPKLLEQPLVSEKYGYGGTLDFYGLIDGVWTLKDFKTAKAIFPEHIYQDAAYRQLLEENGHKVEAVGILQIGRDETEGFSEKVITNTSREWQIFKHCLALYNLRAAA
jgi:hypothetical protein